MLHLVLSERTLKLFWHGVAPQEYIAHCEADLPAGHYAVTDIDGDTITAKPIRAKEISTYAVRGRAIGVRARWCNDRVLLNGVDAPLANECVTFTFPNLEYWLREDAPVFLSVGAFHVY